MVNYQERSKRSRTGAKYKKSHKKRKNRLGSPPIETAIDDPRMKQVRTRGGNIKLKLFSNNFINVSIPSEKVTKKVQIKKLESNKASKDYDRRNIMTKGAILETELGLVKVTSRPGQHGILNGILLEE